MQTRSKKGNPVNAGTESSDLSSRIRAILKGKARENETKSEAMTRILTTTPLKPKGADIPHYIKQTRENIIHQTDLLYLPTDKFGYKYVLVVVDISDWRCDAVPLKAKTVTAVLGGFRKIYEERRKLKFPFKIQYDSGKEFEGSVPTYFISHNVIPKVSMVNQHSQTAFAERLNLKIGKVVGHLQAQAELESGKTAKGWVYALDTIVDELNKDADVNKAKNNQINTKETKEHNVLVKNAITTEEGANKAINKFGDDIKNKRDVTEIKQNVPIIGTISKDILDEGDKVRIKLNRPIDWVQGKRLHGGFRKGDARWSKEVHIVEKVNLLPNQVPTYFVSGIRNRAFPKHELLVAS